jgi:hypothetical protein
MSVCADWQSIAIADGGGPIDVEPGRRIDRIAETA